MSESLNSDLNEAIDNTPYLVKLPEKGWGTEKILEEAIRYTKFGEYFFFLAVWQAAMDVLYIITISELIYFRGT